MALPTTQEEMKRLLDSMKAQGASEAEKKFIIDEFIKQQKGASESFLGRAAITAGEAASTLTTQEKATGVIQENAAQAAMPEPAPKKGLLQKVVEFIPGESGIERAAAESETGVAGLREGLKETIPGQTIVGTVEGVSTAAEGLGDIREGITKEGLTAAERTTDVVGGVADIIGGGLQTVFAPLSAVAEATPVVSTIFEKIGEGTNAISTFFADKIGTTSQEKEALTKSFNNLINLGLIKAAPAGQEVGLKALKTGVKVGTKVLKKGIKGTQFLGEEALLKSSGLNRETIKTIAESPNKAAEVKKVGVEVARRDIFTRVKDNIDTKIAELEETGTQYNNIRQSGQHTKLPETFYDDLVSAQGLTAEFVNGKLKLKATSESTVRASADLAALEKALEPFWDKTDLSANEFLNFRSDLAHAAKFETGKTNAATTVSKAWRKELNKVGRDQIKGLKKLDTEFSPQIKKLKKVKELIYDKRGNLKDNALQTINNLLGKGKEAKLTRIEQILPEFTADLKAIKAIQDVELTIGNKVGTYARSGALPASIALAVSTGNILPLVGFILTSPRLIIGVVETFGKAKAKLSQGQVKTITTKISKGVQLTKNESAIVTDLLKKISDREAAEFIIAAGSDTESPSSEIPTK